MVGYGGMWCVCGVEGCGGVWRGVEGCGGVWRGVVGCGGVWWGVVGCGVVLKGVGYIVVACVVGVVVVVVFV